jgi:hypothetical protein
MRPRHPKKHIEAAVGYAESRGWRVELSAGHAWGFLLCPRYGQGGCDIAVYSTPRSDGGSIGVRTRKGAENGIRTRIHPDRRRDL